MDVEKNSPKRQELNRRLNINEADQDPGHPLNHIDSYHSPHEHENPAYRRRRARSAQSVSRPVTDRGDNSSTSSTVAEEDQYEDNLVVWDGDDDRDNAQNWSARKRWGTTALLGFTTMGATLSSSIFSAAIPAVSREFGISTEVATLGIALFILGFVFGPVFFAPISETYGRKLSVLAPYFLFSCFSVATAVSQDIQSVMITRFFAGLFASAPVANVGGGLADMFDAKTRGVAVVFYSYAVVGGPTLGPLIGAAVTESYLGWRWTQYLVCIYTAAVFLIGLFFLDETYAPVILSRRAQKLRLKTKNWALHSQLETQDLSFLHFLEKNVIRALKMLFTEPILLAVCLFNAFCYGVLYLLFEAFPIIFEQHRGWTPVSSSLVFLSVLVGVLIAGVINIFWSVKYFAPSVKRNNGKVIPENRLPPMMLGALLFPIGFFWLGWTIDSHWINGVLAAAFIGCAFLLIFQTGINYIIDCYTVYAASAVAANTFLRSIVAAGFSMAAAPMYHTLGISWACSLLGFVAVALMGIPFLFYVYGSRLRARSKMAAK